MSGVGGADTPPEVPEEFAAAYRAAYERALAAQSDHPHRAFEPTEGDELPRRNGPPRLTSHRQPREARPPRPARSPRPERERSSRPQPRPWVQPEDRAPGRPSPWLVPLLLAVLVLIMVLGAYVVGRVISERVGSPEPAPTPGASATR